MSNSTEWCRMLHSTLSAETRKSMNSTKMITQKEIDEYSFVQRYKDTKVYTVNINAVETLKRALYDCGKIGVLNYMSYINPTLNWRNGIVDWESLLCSCSTLSSCLLQYADDFFQENCDRLNDGMYTSDCLFTEKCYFYDEENLMWKKETSVLSMAMPKWSENESDKYFLILLQRARDAIKVFNMFGCDSIIIGKETPDSIHMEAVWSKIINSYGGLFKRVYIAQS